MGAISGFRLKSSGMKEVLNSSGTRSMLTDKAGPVLAAAQASAPVDTGAYKASLHIEQATTDRAVVRVAGGTDHDWVVEAKTGNLARALDAAR